MSLEVNDIGSISWEAVLDMITDMSAPGIIKVLEERVRDL